MQESEVTVLKYKYLAPCESGWMPAPPDSVVREGSQKVGLTPVNAMGVPLNPLSPDCGTAQSLTHPACCGTGLHHQPPSSHGWCPAGFRAATTCPAWCPNDKSVVLVGHLRPLVEADSPLKHTSMRQGCPQKCGTVVTCWNVHECSTLCNLPNAGRHCHATVSTEKQLWAALQPNNVTITVTSSETATTHHIEVLVGDYWMEGARQQAAWDTSEAKVSNSQIMTPASFNLQQRYVLPT